VFLNFRPPLRGRAISCWSTTLRAHRSSTLVVTHIPITPRTFNTFRASHATRYLERDLTSPCVSPIRFTRSRDVYTIYI
jgi:hypothetical protein